MTRKHDQDAGQFVAALLYASTTESMVPWDWLEKSRDRKQILSEWERVQMLLRAVNGEQLRVAEWNRFCGAPLASKMFKVSVTEDARVEDMPVPLLENARAALHGTLKEVIADRDETGPDVTKNLPGFTAGRLISVREKATNGTVTDRVIAYSIGEALAHAVALAIDPTRPFLRRIRRCAYSKCECFALVKPPSGRGQPANHYCSKEHKDEHRKEQARQWKRDQRRSKEGRKHA